MYIYSKAIERVQAPGRWKLKNWRRKERIQFYLFKFALKMENKNHRAHNNEGRAELILNSSAFINFEKEKEKVFAARDLHWKKSKRFNNNAFRNFGELTFFPPEMLFTSRENQIGKTTLLLLVVLFLFLTETFKTLLLAHFALSFVKFRGFVSFFRFLLATVSVLEMFKWQQDPWM